MSQRSRKGAAIWFAKARSGDGLRREHGDFAAWLEADPGNAAAYEELERLYARSWELRDTPAIRIALRKARRGWGRATSAAWRNAFFAASAFAATMAAVWLGPNLHRLMSGGNEMRYATEIGEQRSVMLDDGSTILIDSGSIVRTYSDAGMRRAVVERGQVQFQIVHNPKRPFEVEIGRATIHDIGTLFQARLDDGHALVTLVEGTLKVSASERSGAQLASEQGEILTPGEQIAVDSHGMLEAKRLVDLGVARSWTQGELIFENRTLEEILHEMNRYTHRRIVAHDPAVQSIRISGTFHASDQQSLLRALHLAMSLGSKSDAENNIVLYREHK